MLKGSQEPIILINVSLYMTNHLSLKWKWVQSWDVRLLVYVIMHSSCENLYENLYYPSLHSLPWFFPPFSVDFILKGGSFLMYFF